MIWDAGQHHFGVRVTPAGVKSFVVLIDSGQLKVIGRYDTITLAQARAAAAQLLAEKTLGTYQPCSIKFELALETFFEKHCAGLRTRYEYERMLRRDILPHLKGKTLDKITGRQIIHVLDGFSPSIAHHAYTYVRAFFNWAVGRSYLKYSPLDRMKAPKKGRPRRPLVTDEQLQAIWHALEDDAYGNILRLLILTGQRRSEIAHLVWPNIGKDEINLPRTKNDHAHTFPLGPVSKEIIKSAPRLNSTPLLFPSDALTVFAGWSLHKKELDKRSGVSDWTLHSLRRKFRTLHARFGTPPHIAERLINHVTGVASDVELIYDFHTYMPEMRAAVENYERELNKILHLPE
jgi:integrase